MKNRYNKFEVRVEQDPSPSHSSWFVYLSNLRKWVARCATGGRPHNKSANKNHQIRNQQHNTGGGGINAGLIIKDVSPACEHWYLGVNTSALHNLTKIFVIFCPAYKKLTLQKCILQLSIQWWRSGNFQLGKACCYATKEQETITPQKNSKLPIVAAQSLCIFTNTWFLKLRAFHGTQSRQRWDDSMGWCWA